MSNPRNMVCPTMIWLSCSLVLVPVRRPSRSAETVIIVLSRSFELDTVWVNVLIDVGRGGVTDWFPVEARKHCHCIQSTHVCHTGAANKHQHNNVEFVLFDYITQFFDPVKFVKDSSSPVWPLLKLVARDCDLPHHLEHRVSNTYTNLFAFEWQAFTKVFDVLGAHFERMMAITNHGQIFGV